jgi:hypothetical protein
MPAAASIQIKISRLARHQPRHRAGDQEVDADVVQGVERVAHRQRHRVEEEAATVTDDQAQAEDEHAELVEALLAAQPQEQNHPRHCQDHPGEVRPGTHRVSEMEPGHASRVVEV